MTVLEVIQRSSEFLARRGVDSPRLQVELLLAHTLQMPRMKLYLNFDRVLTADELDALRGLVRRRGEREPLQYLVGSTSFCGIELAVTPDALIPRPETELLAEQGWKFLQAVKDGPGVALDFGTGSGCLAIALALHCPSSEVHAVDISEPALALARANAARHGLSDRIRFHRGDGLEAVPAGQLFDLIAANPPYIPTEEIATLQPEVRDHEPRLALDGGHDGADFYRHLAAGAGPRLGPGGALMMELGDGQTALASGLFSGSGWAVEPVLKDDSGRERILIARRLV